MPARSVRNGLKVETLPTELNDITTMENTLIARDIPFMKTQLVPKSRMEKMVDQTVLVPVEPLLLRSMADSAVIAIEFK